MSTVLQVRNLTKQYGNTRAVSDVSFSVEKGEIVGLLGPNGAGKTSTISMLLGILEPTQGTIAVCGHDLARERSLAMKKANFAAVYAALPGNLTVRQNLDFFARIYDVPNRNAKLTEVLAMLDLERFEHTRTGLLSSGEQTRVGLAKAFITEPELLLLDEPTASLDPATAQTIRERIVTYAREGRGGVLWTSHNMQEVTDVCTRVLFLSHGSVILAGDPKQLPATHHKKDLEELFISVAREPLALDL